MGRPHAPRSHLARLAVVIGLICVGLVFALLLAREDEAFVFLKNHVRDIRAVTEARPVLAWIGFTLFYLLYVGCFLPGTAALSLVGGAVFGFWSGLLATSIARSVGAVMAFLISRAALRGWATARHGAFIAKIDAAVARDGPFYLFLLRMAPVAPYNLTNLAMGLTGMRLPTYFGVTLVGMLPRAALWVNAGSQLATLESPRDVASPRVALSLLAAGLAPLLLRMLLRRLRPGL